MSRPRRGPVIVFGIMFWYPLAGVTWQFLHYLIGLRRLGYDPYYVEDSARWVYDPDLDDLSPDARPNVEAVAPVLEAHGFHDRWCFRGHYPGGRCYGLDARQLSALYVEAEAFLNVTGAQELREEHLQCRRRVYVETDPVASQVRVADADPGMMAMLSAHDVLFSYGERLGLPGCGVPVEGFDWMPTRQPVLTDVWHDPAAVDRGAYTTIATWRNKGKDIVLDGETYYWSKEREFMSIIDLPRRRAVPFEIATSVDADAEVVVRRQGWRLADPHVVSRDLAKYRRYICESHAEFTVAKDQNVRLCSGWFSDRSACYLAAGRPVVTQETGFSGILPTGHGLFGWRSIDDILSAVDAIESNYAAHSKAARELAAEYFSAEKVLHSLMTRADL